MRTAQPSAAGLRCILLVAQEDATRLTAKWALANVGYIADVARSAEEALNLFNPKLHDVVMTADAIPGVTGPELAHIIKLRSPSTAVVLLAGQAAPEDHSCLDAVLENGARAGGLTTALQGLLAEASQDANPALPKPPSETRRLRNPGPDLVPQAQAEKDPRP